MADLPVWSISSEPDTHRQWSTFWSMTSATIQSPDGGRCGDSERLLEVELSSPMVVSPRSKTRNGAAKPGVGSEQKLRPPRTKAPSRRWRSITSSHCCCLFDSYSRVLGRCWPTMAPNSSMARDHSLNLLTFRGEVFSGENNQCCIPDGRRHQARRSAND